MKILGDQIRNNPDRVLSNMPKVNARLETGQFAFPFVSYCYYVK
jgi:ionotropic glutamate receptor